MNGFPRGDQHDRHRDPPHRHPQRRPRDHPRGRGVRRRAASVPAGHRPPRPKGGGGRRPRDAQGDLAAQRRGAGGGPDRHRRRRREGGQRVPSGAAPLGGHAYQGAGCGDAPLPRSRARPPGRLPRPDPGRERQGPSLGLRGGHGPGHDRPLLRPAGPAGPEAQVPDDRGAGPHLRQGAPGPQGSRRGHLAVELPAGAGRVRRHTRAARRQRHRHQARLPDPLHRAAGLRAHGGGRPAQGTRAGRDRTGHPGGQGHHRLGRLPDVHRIHRDRPDHRGSGGRAVGGLLGRARGQEPDGHHRRRRPRPHRRRRHHRLLRQHRAALHLHRADIRPRPHRR